MHILLNVATENVSAVTCD